MNDHKTYKIGLISDTHGLLRPEAVKALEGCDHIVHAGDIEDKKILKQLSRIAPVSAVRGNMDRYGWAMNLPEKDMIEACGLFIYVLHDLNAIDIDPEAAGIDVVVSGHTHKPHVHEKNGVLYVNPGSAGYRRHNNPLSVGIVMVDKKETRVQIIRFDNG